MWARVWWELEGEATLWSSVASVCCVCVWLCPGSEVWGTRRRVFIQISTRPRDESGKTSCLNVPTSVLLVLCMQCSWTSLSVEHLWVSIWDICHSTAIVMMWPGSYGSVSDTEEGTDQTETSRRRENGLCRGLLIFSWSLSYINPWLFLSVLVYFFYICVFYAYCLLHANSKAMQTWQRNSVSVSAFLIS